MRNDLNMNSNLLSSRTVLCFSDQTAALRNPLSPSEATPLNLRRDRRILRAKIHKLNNQLPTTCSIKAKHDRWYQAALDRVHKSVPQPAEVSASPQAVQHILKHLTQEEIELVAEDPVFFLPSLKHREQFAEIARVSWSELLDPPSPVKQVLQPVATASRVKYAPPMPTFSVKQKKGLPPAASRSALVSERHLKEREALQAKLKASSAAAEARAKTQAEERQVTRSPKVQRPAPAACDLHLQVWVQFKEIKASLAAYNKQFYLSRKVDPVASRLHKWEQKVLSKV